MAAGVEHVGLLCDVHQVLLFALAVLLWVFDEFLLAHLIEIKIENEIQE